MRLVNQEPLPLFGLAVRARVIRQWNQTVDDAFEPLITGLAKRNL